MRRFQNETELISIYISNSKDTSQPEEQMIKWENTSQERWQRRFHLSSKYHWKTHCVYWFLTTSMTISNKSPPIYIPKQRPSLHKTKISSTLSWVHWSTLSCHKPSQCLMRRGLFSEARSDRKTLMPWINHLCKPCLAQDLQNPVQGSKTITCIRCPSAWKFL